MSDFGPGIVPAPQHGELEGTLLLARNETAIRGQMSWANPRRIPPDALAYSKNLKTWRDGYRTRMPGSQAVGAASAHTGGGNGLGYGEDSGTEWVLAHWGDRIYTSTGGAWTRRGTLITFPDQPSQIIQGAGVRASDGTQVPFFYFAWPTSTTRDLYNVEIGGWTGGNTTDLGGRCLLYWQDRLWSADGLTISYSPVGGPDFQGGATVKEDAVPAVDQYIGDEIMALLPARGLDPFMLIFLRRQIFVLQVKVDGTTGGIDFNSSFIKPVTSEVGTIATRSAVTLGPFALFLAHDGVRVIQRALDDSLAGTREPISRPIQDVIDTINWTYADESVAVAYGGRYYLSVPTGAATSCNTVLVWDLETKSWSVWPGSGERGWYGAAVTEIGLTPKLHYLSTALETYSSVQANHVFYFDDDTDNETDGTTETAITTEEQGAALTFGAPEAEKEWRWIEVEYANPDASDQATMTVYAKVDGGSWTQVVSVGVASATDERTRTKWELYGFGPGRQIQIKITESGSGQLQIFGYTVAAYVLPIGDD